MINAVVDSEINDDIHGSDHVPISLTIDTEKIQSLKSNGERKCDK